MVKTHIFQQYKVDGRYEFSVKVYYNILQMVSAASEQMSTDSYKELRGSHYCTLYKENC